MIFKSLLPDLFFPGKPLGQHILSVIEKFGDSVAFLDIKTQTEITYSQLREEALEYTKVLWKAGLRKGDIVGLVIPFEVQYVPLLIAIANCGGVIFGTKLLYKSAIHKQLAAIQPRLVITTRTRYEEIAEDLKMSSPSVKLCVSFDQIKNIGINVLETDEFDELPCYEAIDVHKDPLFIYQTSGTTGKPKGIVCTNYSMISSAYTTTIALRLIPGHVFWSQIGLIHAGGMWTLFACLLGGVKHIISPAVGAKELLLGLSKYKVDTVLSTSVKMLKEMADMNEIPPSCGGSSSSSPLVIVGGTSFPPQLIKSVRKKFAIQIGSIYGLTESGFVSFANGASPAASCGYLLHNVAAKIISEKGEELGYNQVGELCIQSPQMMLKYQLQDGSAPVGLVDGWLHTGDLAYFDENNYLYICGRSKDVIKIQQHDSIIGAVLPAELEEVLFLHPQVLDVVVVGVPHPTYGEAPKAYVVRKDETLTENDVLDFFRNKVEKVTDLQGGVEFIDSIPKSGLGKPIRHLLLERHMQSHS